MKIFYNIKNKKYKAHYKDRSGFLVRFGPYPNRKSMINSIKEYAYKINENFTIKKEQV